MAINYLINAVMIGLFVASLADAFKANMIILMICSIPVTLLAYHFSVRGMLSLVKWIVAGPTRILAFRRYSSASAPSHRTIVLPTIGAFGYIVAFEDETLKQAPSGMFWESQDLLSGAFYHMPAGGDDWQQRLEIEVASADFVVFDWIDIPTPFMIAEFDLALKIMPQERLTWTVPNAQVKAVSEWARNHGVNSPMVIGVSNSRLRLARDFQRAITTVRATSRWLRTP